MRARGTTCNLLVALVAIATAGLLAHVLIALTAGHDTLITRICSSAT